MRHAICRSFAGLLGILSLAACGGQAVLEAGEDSVETVASALTYPDANVCNPTNTGFTANISHPYLPLTAGNRWAFVGSGGNVRLVIRVLAETQVIEGVTTRVVLERGLNPDGSLHELARNFMVQAADGTVCYYGEDVNYYDKNGNIISHEGTWRVGVGGALPGISMPANPQIGMDYPIERAPGIAEDRAQVTGFNREVTTPDGTFRRTLVTTEYNPLEPEDVSIKIYALGVGLVKDDLWKLKDFDDVNDPERD
jgi:hypothetical protein